MNELTAVQRLVNLRNALLKDIDNLSEFEVIGDCNLAGIEWRGLTHLQRVEFLKNRIRNTFTCVEGL